MAIVRTPLREQVKDAVIDLIAGGKLEPGARINEAPLAEELGVSRTPLREALHLLEREGLVVSEPGRGFSVATISARDVREIYPLIAELEALALRSTEKPRDLDRLRRINDDLERASGNSPRCQRLDEEFHAELTTGHGNARVQGLLEELKRISRIYEHSYMKDAASIPVSVSHHRQIVDALEEGDVGAAAEALRANWAFGEQRLLELVDGS